ncbi:MAG: primase C-terminal domain-containing protein [Clostridia bacterium]|nr:primase C-terminal domain-containing protein [Clostridia bacterium]
MFMYHADCTGNEKNCQYRHRVEITDEASLLEVVRHDYVCAEYQDGYRSNSNFIGSDCVAMDFDNDHSENPEDWVRPQQIVDALPGVTVAIHYSRNHMRIKKGKPARPKFHVIIAIDPVTDAKAYAAMKRKLAAFLPFADMNALDSARFFFGTEDPLAEFYPGTKTLNDILNEEDFDSGMDSGSYGDQVITEGKRNATMSRKAGKIVKRFGYTEEAHALFLKEAEKCEPPLEDDELERIWRSAARTVKWAQEQPGYIPPEVYNAIGSLKPDDYSDVGQAKVIAQECANELAYTPGTDYIRFTGKRWEESKPKALGLVIDFLDRQLADADTCLQRAQERLEALGVSKEAISAGGKTLEKLIQDKQIEAYHALLGAIAYRQFVMKRRDMKYIQSAMQAARPMVEIDQNDLDSHENLLNCPDGTYDLSQGLRGRHEHDSDEYITKMTAAAPGDEGSALWQKSLELIFQGDRELIEYVQRIVGLTAIGEVYQEAMIIAYGDGSNGKSTFWNTIAAVMGDYAGLISADVLTVGCKRNVKPELAEAKGMRLLIASELEEGQRLSTSIVKQLCSTDKIEGEKKYKDPFKFKPTHTLVLYTNHLPRVGATDSGIWRRLIVIPFNARITGNSDIKNYSKYLVNHAAPAIMKWIIEGAEKAIHDHYHLKIPKCVQNAIARYKSDNDWMSHFLDECCETGEGLREKSGELFAAYRAFCGRTNDFCRSTTEFYTALEQRGFTRHKCKTGIIVLGLKLAEETLSFQ